MTVLVIESPPSVAATTIDRGPRRERDLDVEATFLRRVAEQGRCAYYLRQVTCECAQGVVRLRGRVPTRRLKQLLWSLAQELGGRVQIDDQVDVINSAGLSCVCSVSADSGNDAPVQ